MFRPPNPPTSAFEGVAGIVTDPDFQDRDEYEKARSRLQQVERSLAFNAHVKKARNAAIEAEAAELVKKIRAYDWDHTYRPVDAHGRPTGTRTEGEHFLGNVDLINKTELFKVARRMPKGAHLHVHFNACLPAEFLIREARDVEAMYIRSTLPLTSEENFDKCRISFMVQTPFEATHLKNGNGEVEPVGLGNIFANDYIPNRWMRYKDFQKKFHIKRGEDVESSIEAVEEWLVHKMHISEEEAHNTRQTGRGIWERFNYRTQMMKGLFAYESAYRNYTRACIRDFVEDNIQYAEIRPNFMSNNSLKTDDGEQSIGNDGMMQIIEKELKATVQELQSEGKYFGGMKVIYCTPRSFEKKEVRDALNECIALKKDHQDLVCGFDLVGHEELGNELRHFTEEFLDFRRKCKKENLDIPFLFHCGETLDVGDKVDGNLYDAVLLGAKRIGHGYAVARHPLIMDIFKQNGIAIESCPISNEILGLTPVIAGHHLPILLANNVPCTINSDNATFYRSSLSHDFYQVMIGSNAMDLYGWKQLIIWSLEKSCMSDAERESVTREWEVRWDEFCQWIVKEYGKRLENWTPRPGRH
ncbi:adenosine deaminase family protein-like protein [Xylogone sp. PMI_703]|nr:adenosine deaminase family protein-like protein [Xylogone sp. PMI_703]